MRIQSHILIHGRYILLVIQDKTRERGAEGGSHARHVTVQLIPIDPKHGKVASPIESYLGEYSSLRTHPRNETTGYQADVNAIAITPSCRYFPGDAINRNFRLLSINEKSGRIAIQAKVNPLDFLPNLKLDAIIGHSVYVGNPLSDTIFGLSCDVASPPYDHLFGFRPDLAAEYVGPRTQHQARLQGAQAAARARTGTSYPERDDEDNADRSYAESPAQWNRLFRFRFDTDLGKPETEVERYAKQVGGVGAHVHIGPRAQPHRPKGVARAVL